MEATPDRRRDYFESLRTHVRLTLGVVALATAFAHHESRRAPDDIRKENREAWEEARREEERLGDIINGKVPASESVRREAHRKYPEVFGKRLELEG